MTTPETGLMRRWAGDELPPSPHPAPQVPARLAEPGEVPKSALRWVAKADAYDWQVIVTYARGHRLPSPREAKARIPGPLVESIAVRLYGPDGSRAVVTWERIPGADKPAWKAAVAYAWQSGQFPRVAKLTRGKGDTTGAGALILLEPFMAQAATRAAVDKVSEAA